ncbi:MAG TPA: electron transfer flavoprotein beta subunit/FixA family protein, partial [Caldithrix sp.]|nr:electron transfer flavoprotein beta subunit/FixA family protein [Caldithrix sp.]
MSCDFSVYLKKKPKGGIIVNIAVCIKQVPDSETRPKIAEGNTQIVKEGIKWIVNPYDEIAVEQALQLTEKNGGEVTVISLGPVEVEPAIRGALAMGAHKAIRIDAPENPSDPRVVARALAEVLKDKNFDLILFGKQAIDDDMVQVPQMVGEALGLPCVTVVVKMEIDDQTVISEREIEGGKERLRFTMPGIISAQKGLNEPRYRSLKGIMMAKKIPIEVATVSLAADH